MAYPTKYTRKYDFASYQNANPTRPLPGDKVNVDYNAVKLSIDEIIEFLKGFTRSDGRLANGSVGLAQFDSSVDVGFDLPTTWASATDYEITSTVFNGNRFYKANEKHTSGGSFDESKWELIVDFGEQADAAALSAAAAAASAALADGYLYDVQSAAAQALDSEIAAEAAATASAASAAAASDSFDDAFAQVALATAQAVIATTKAGEADASADAAAAAAASIPALSSQAEAEAGSVNNKYMTPLRTSQAIAASPVFATANGLAPASPGGATSFLRADGSWAVPPTGGAGSPGGSTTQIQFNDAGGFAGDGGFVWDNTGKKPIIATTIAATTTAPVARFNATYGDFDSVPTLDVNLNGGSTVTGRIGFPINVSGHSAVAFYATPNISSTAATEIMRVNGGAANVGIGTTTPNANAKLHVAGNVIATNLYANVLTYGAVGDGTTDCKAAFDAAAAAAKTVRVPPGTYKIASNATWPAGVRWLFDDGAVIAPATGTTTDIRGTVDAGFQRIFNGAGTVKGLREVRVEWFGAVGDNSTDNLAAFNAAQACVADSDDSNGQRPHIMIGRGIFRFTSTWNVYPGVFNSLKISGAGPYLDGTRLMGNGIDVIKIHGIAPGGSSNLTSFEMRDLYSGNWSYSATSPAGVGLKFNESADTKTMSGQTESLIENCIFEGCQYGVIAYRLIKALFRRCVFSTKFSSGSARGVLLYGQNDGVSVFGCDTIRFENCHWEGISGNTSVIGVVLESSSNISAIRFDGCEWLAIDRPAYMLASNGAAIGDVWFDKCQFDNANYRGIEMVTSGTGLITDVHIVDNFASAVGEYFVSGVAATLNYINSVFITNNWVAGVSGGTSARAVQMYNTSSWSVQGNIFTGCGSTVTPLLLDAVIFGQNCVNTIIANNVAGQGGTTFDAQFQYMVQMAGTNTGTKIFDNNTCGRHTVAPVGGTMGGAIHYGNGEANSGKLYLPDGRLMQWGTVNGNGSADTTVNFPTAYASTPTVTANLISAPGTTIIESLSIVVNTSGVTGYPRYNSSGTIGRSSANWTWMAIGLV